MRQFWKKLDRVGRKIKDMNLEEMLLEWITLQRSKNLRVSRKPIQRKARIYAEEKGASKGQMDDFCACEGWKSLCHETGYGLTVARFRRKKCQIK